MKRNGLILTVLLLLIAGTAQSQTPAPTPIPIRSIFLDDTCAPPCWFGITPGESTSADVEAMFQANEKVFEWYCYYCHSDENEPALRSPFFGFYWRTYTRNDTPLMPEGTSNSQALSYIVIDGKGVVGSIYMWANQIVTLGETLAALGVPDDAYLVPMFIVDEAGNSGDGILLRYTDERLMIWLVTFPKPTCEAASVLTDFHVDTLDYLSIDSALELAPRDVTHDPEGTQRYPILVQPVLGDGRQIRGADWDRFVNGEGYTQCEDFFDSLPDTYIVPTLPWPSPTLTPTPDQG